MKYLYKQTGVVVESSIPLDSAIFAPINDEAPKMPVEEQAAPVEEAEAPVEDQEEPVEETDAPAEAQAAPSKPAAGRRRKTAKK